MQRNFTMRKVCPTCRCGFTITSAASVYCQTRSCQNKRRRERRAELKAPRVGTEGHLKQAIESGE